MRRNNLVCWIITILATFGGLYASSSETITVEEEGLFFETDITSGSNWSHVSTVVDTTWGIPDFADLWYEARWVPDGSGGFKQSPNRGLIMFHFRGPQGDAVQPLEHQSITASYFETESFGAFTNVYGSIQDQDGELCTHVGANFGGSFIPEGPASVLHRQYYSYDEYRDVWDISGSIPIVWNDPNANPAISDLHLSLVSLPPIPGDNDGDGDLDGVDLGISFANFTGPVGVAGGKTYLHGDTDGDGDVDGIDLGNSFANFTGPLSSTTTAVPEPSTMIILGLGGLLIIRQRRG